MRPSKPRLLLLSSCLLVAAAAYAQDDVPFLSVTSTDGANLIELQHPPTGPYGSSRVIGRIDRFPLSPDDVDLDQLAFLVDVQGAQGEQGFVVHTGLDNGRTYFYSVFVHDGQSSWSNGKQVQGLPIDTTGPIRWRFYTGTGTVSMSPPGLGSVLLVLSNDGNLYPLARGHDGGSWAQSGLPLRLGQPAQHRPPVIPAAGITEAENLALIASQDGFVRGVNADTGELLWSSPPFGMLQASPAVWFSAFSGSQENFVYVGSRNALARNAFHAIDASDGTPWWSFDDPAGTGIGIISGGANIDYVNGAAYFASQEIAPGAHTVWAVDLVSGQKLWSVPLGGVSGSPVQRGNDLYVGADDGLVHAIEVRDGSMKLNFPFDTEDGRTKGFVFPNYAGDEIYFSTETTVWALRDVMPVVVKRWSHPGIAGPSIPVYPPGRRYLWVGSSDGRLYQLDVTTGNPVQPPETRFVTLTDGSAGVGSPTYDVAHGLVYVGTEDGAVFAVTAPF